MSEWLMAFINFFCNFLCGQKVAQKGQFSEAGCQRTGSHGEDAGPELRSFCAGRTCPRSCKNPKGSFAHRPTCIFTSPATENGNPARADAHLILQIFYVLTGLPEIPLEIKRAYVARGRSIAPEMEREVSDPRVWVTGCVRLPHGSDRADRSPRRFQEPRSAHEHR